MPMSAAACEAFKRVLENRKGGKSIQVDGYSNFLFLNRDGLPKVAVNYYAHATFHSAQEEMDRLEAKAEIKVVNTEKVEAAA